MTQDLEQTEHFKPKTDKGEFVRVDSGFRHWITTDGAAGPTGSGGFKAEPGRYHLYVSHACPWANRTMIMRNLKQLQDHITVNVVHPLMGPESWHFGDYPGSTADTVNHCGTMKAVYQLADPDYSGVVTVPVLWDKQQQTVVNNESSEIIRMFNSAFNKVTGNEDDYYPEALRTDIDEVNERIYNTLNNGVYRCGFASTQEAYEKAFDELFATLDYLETRLQGEQWLVGNTLTEADLRLFPTLVRFDAVYHGHFKCNLKRLLDYPNLQRHTENLFDNPAISETVDMQQIKYHYYASHKSLNPTGIVPKGPAAGFG